ncbi:MAG: twin-arginine translocase subunit TatC [Actinomycetia bacterium]|nr:twin-arginine translocase subunit TatC [Actinomycetes bacterium]
MRNRILKGAERDPSNMALSDHLRELRRRLFICLATVAVALIPAWFAYPWLADFLNEPYCSAVLALDPEANCKFLETDIIAPFALRMRVAGWGAVVLAMPVILWQLWRFIAPGLYRKERRYAFAFVGSGMVLFALGAGLAYFTLSRATEFLIGIAGSEVEVRAGIGNFTRLALFMMVAFGIGFQFPVVMVALQIIGVVTPQKLASWRRQVILLIVVLAAGITPSGDPFSLFALAIPMYLLFEVSLLIGRLWLRRRTKREKAAAEAEARAAGSDADRSGP